MNTRTEIALARHKVPKIGLIVAMLIAPMGSVAAQERYPSGAGLHYRAPHVYKHRSVAVSRWDRWRFHRSGTRGREGLGASPTHPEGPGNVSH